MRKKVKFWKKIRNHREITKNSRKWWKNFWKILRIKNFLLWKILKVQLNFKELGKQILKEKTLKHGDNFWKSSWRPMKNGEKTVKDLYEIWPKICKHLRTYRKISCEIFEFFSLFSVAVRWEYFDYIKQMSTKFWETSIHLTLQKLKSRFGEGGEYKNWIYDEIWQGV